MKTLLGLILFISLLSACHRASKFNPQQPQLDSNREIPEAVLFGEENDELDETVLLKRRSAGSSSHAVRAHHTGSGSSSTNQDFGSSQYQQYGYGYSDPLLAYAEMARYRDPSIMSVVKVRFGNNFFFRQNNQNQSITDRWNFTLNSASRVSVLKIYRNAQGSGSIQNQSSNAITVNWTTNISGRGGFIFAIHSGTSQGCQQDYDWNDDWYQGNDPWNMGYNGMWNNYQYYYPPQPNSNCHEDTSLVIQGSVVGSCTPAEVCTPATISINDNLAPYINNYAGYLPVYRRNLSNSQVITGKFVNFNGPDWYYPLQ